VQGKQHLARGAAVYIGCDSGRVSHSAVSGFLRLYFLLANCLLHTLVAGPADKEEKSSALGLS
jgi:hypothetical protein